MHLLHRSKIPSQMPRPNASIPSYEEATSAITNAQPTPDTLPSYTEYDNNARTYSLYSTFIHTPTSATYQLSSPVHSATSPLRIRRLNASEIPLAHSHPIPFTQTETLYEIADPPWLWRQNAYYILGRREGSCYPGTLQLRFGFRTWRVSVVGEGSAAAASGAARELVWCRRVGGRKGRESGFEEAFVWKDGGGKVMATEGLRRLEGGEVVPGIELGEGLDAMWRELMICLWMARLWAVFRVL